MQLVMRCGANLKSYRFIRVYAYSYNDYINLMQCDHCPAVVAQQCPNIEKFYNAKPRQVLKYAQELKFRSKTCKLRKLAIDCREIAGNLHLFPNLESIAISDAYTWQLARHVTQYRDNKLRNVWVTLNYDIEDLISAINCCDRLEMININVTGRELTVPKEIAIKTPKNMKVFKLTCESSIVTQLDSLHDVITELVVNDETERPIAHILDNRFVNLQSITVGDQVISHRLTTA